METPGKEKQKLIAFVTGAGRGIGEAICIALAGQGIAIAALARTEEDIQRVAGRCRQSGGTAIAVQCDVTDPTSISNAIAVTEQQLGKINILVNNAGASGSHKFLGHDDSLWHKMINTNLNSVYFVTKAVLPSMIDQKWGRIINIASTSARVGGKYIAAYTASKHGALGLTRALATELAEHNITVNAVCPGYVDTPMTDQTISNITARARMSPPEARAVLERMNPQGRLITVEEVAAIVAFLVSNEARGISGQAVNIDGGAVQS